MGGNTKVTKGHKKKGMWDVGEEFSAAKGRKDGAKKEGDTIKGLSNYHATILFWVRVADSGTREPAAYLEIHFAPVQPLLVTPPSQAEGDQGLDRGGGNA